MLANTWEVKLRKRLLPQRHANARERGATGGWRILYTPTAS